MFLLIVGSAQTVSAQEASSTPPFTITASAPAAGAMSVPVTVIPTLTFSNQIKSAGATSTHVQLRDFTSDAPVLLNISPSGDGLLLTLQPTDGPLGYSQKYYFYVDATVKDIYDQGMSGWVKSNKDNHAFTTEAAPIIPPDATSTPPEATSTVPAEPTATSTASEKDTPRYDTSGFYRRNGGRSKSVSVATPKVLGAVTFVASDVPTLGLFATNLGLGSVGPMVLVLQERLVGENLYHGALDSHFGPQLAVAVRAYQLAHELPVTGFVGVLTRAALNAE